MTDFNRHVNMDTKNQRESITRLKDLPGVQRIFTAHYGYPGDILTAFGRKGSADIAIE